MYILQQQLISILYHYGLYFNSNTRRNYRRRVIGSLRNFLFSFSMRPFLRRIGDVRTGVIPEFYMKAQSTQLSGNFVYVHAVIPKERRSETTCKSQFNSSTRRQLQKTTWLKWRAGVGLRIKSS